MVSSCLHAWLLLVLAVFPAPCRSASYPDRSGLPRLYWDLMSNNHRVLPPAGAPVEVSVDLALTYVTVVSDDIVDVDGWLSLMWNDPRFRWDPEEYNTTNIHLPQDMIWTPDITPYNNIDVRQRTTEKFQAMIGNDGRVYVVNKMTIRLPCADNGSGHRACMVKFGSWTYNGFLLDLKASTGMDLSEYTPSKDYQITNATATRNVQHYTCCPEPYPEMTFTFDLERKERGWFF